MEAPGFWDDPEKSQESMKVLKSLKDDVEVYQQLKEQYEEVELLLEMGYEENDPAVIPEIQETLDSFKEAFEAIRIKTLLSGEYDNTNENPATGLPCCIACTAAGRIRRDTSWKCWTIWMEMRRELSP